MEQKLQNASENLKKTGSFIGTHYKTILMVLFGLFILYWLFFILTPSVTMSKEDRTKIDSLNVLIKEINKDQEKLDSKIEGINQDIDKVDNHIDKIKGQKTVVKEIYHEEITRAGSYTEPELDSFFTNRYK